MKGKTQIIWRSIVGKTTIWICRENEYVLKINRLGIKGVTICTLNDHGKPQKWFLNDLKIDLDIKIKIRELILDQLKNLEDLQSMKAVGPRYVKKHKPSHDPAFRLWSYNTEDAFFYVERAVPVHKCNERMYWMIIDSQKYGRSSILLMKSDASIRTKYTYRGAIENRNDFYSLRDKIITERSEEIKNAILVDTILNG